MYDSIIAITAFVLIALVSGNNVSVCTGSVISSRIVKKRTGILMAIVGYSAGLLLQGSLLKFGFSSILPSPSPILVEVALLVSSIIFIISHLYKVSLSLSITFASVLIGIALAAGQAINTYFVLEMIMFWILASAGSVITAFYLMKYLSKRIYQKNIWGGIGRARIVLIAFSFLTAFVLGSNTIGFVYASMSGVQYSLPISILAIIFGSFLVSGREISRVSKDILPMRYTNALISQFVSIAFVEFGTLLSLPLSNSQTFISSLYGVSMSYKTKLILRKPAVMIVSIWVVTAAISAFLGYALTHLLLV